MLALLNTSIKDVNVFTIFIKFFLTLLMALLCIVIFFCIVNILFFIIKIIKIFYYYIHNKNLLKLRRIYKSKSEIDEEIVAVIFCTIYESMPENNNKSFVITNIKEKTTFPSDNRSSTMKRFNVTVNGNFYEVEIEEIDNSTINVNDEEYPSSTELLEDENLNNVISGENVISPMSATVTDIKVSIGQIVSRGDVLIVLEAMNMENEIKALSNGTISSILTSKHSKVKTGDILIIYE